MARGLWGCDQSHDVCMSPHWAWTRGLRQCELRWGRGCGGT